VDLRKDPKPLNFDTPIDFQPHGLSFFRDEAQVEYLFTNNHRRNGNHTVEIFQIEQNGGLKHLETISDKQLTSPNDLVAVGPRQFYLTNDGRAHDRTTRSIDTFLDRKTGNVLFFDGSDFHRVAENLKFPNGIVADPATNQLIVAETLTGKLLFYQIVENWKLVNVDNFFIKKGLDNISINDKGQVLAAVHPNLWLLSKHMKDSENQSPSQIYSLDIQTKGLKLIYQQKGETPSGVSAAIKINSTLYLGAICEQKILKCLVPNSK
jgi:arylesterase/paraoxonase